MSRLIAGRQPGRPAGRRRGRRIGGLLAAVILAAPLALAGCGEGESEAEQEAEHELEQAAESGAPQPVCVDEAERSEAAVPDSFPEAFPLPDGSVVYGSEERSENRVIVYAVVDADVKAVLKQLQTDVPAAGFELTEGEVEERDAESNWTGNGYTGRWAIREVAECPDQTSVTVLAATR